MSGWWLIAALTGWLALSFFLSGMEAGVQVLSRLRIRQWVRTGRPGAKALLEYLDQPENFLWTILVGNTLANFVVLCLILTELQARFGARPEYFWPWLLGLGGAIFLFTDLLPKTLFRRFPNRLCLRLVWLFRLIHFALTPLVRLVERFAALLLFFTRGKIQTGRLFGNRDELRALLHESGGGLIPGERALIHRVLDAQNITVSRLATSFADIPRLTTTTPVSGFLDAARAGGLDRLPVWEAQASRPRVQGVLTLHRVLYRPTAGAALCGDYLTPAVFLDEGLRLDEALRRLQRGGSQLGIVLGSDGGERGFVTLDRVLQTLFGETVT